MEVREFFPFWSELPLEHREDLRRHCRPRLFEKGSMITPYKDNCLGLMLVQAGQLRVFALSDSGREVTLYRLYELDVCLFSASCIMNNIQFDLHIEAEKDTETLLLPTSVFDRLTNQSLAMVNYMNQLMASRFSDVMWTLEQVLFKSMDCRLAQVLLAYARNEESTELSLTHEILARDLGSAREVVTRMLNYFRGEGLLELTRGHIRLLDEKRLAAIAAE